MYHRKTFFSLKNIRINLNNSLYATKSLMRAGPIYMYSAGHKQHLYINHPELVKEMNLSISSDLGKPSYITKRLAPMLGNGILRSNGHLWAQQRKIVAPEFFMNKVKVNYLILQYKEVFTL